MKNIVLSATRFNRYTRDENMRYKTTKGFSGCIYGVPVKIANSIQHNTWMFVFEMDISVDTKDIIGIGLLANVLDRNISCNIYSTPKFNKYIYFSSYHLSRGDMTEDDEDLMSKMRHALFKTKSHVQRSIGITKVPAKNISRLQLKLEDITEQILEMFYRKYSDLKLE